MNDITTVWDPDLGRADWAAGSTPGSDLLSGADLETAVLLSLFTDAVAGLSDVIPDGSRDPRGWWAEPMGSKLWLRARAKKTPDLLELVRSDIAQALAWLIEDQIASAIDITLEWQPPNRLAALIVIRRDAGDVSLPFAWAWGD